MKFTKYNSMNDILAYPDMERYLKIFYSEYLLGMYPEELNDLPVALVEQIAETPWDEPFSIVADQLMDAVNLVADLNENYEKAAVPLWGEDGSRWNLDKEDRGGEDKRFFIAPGGGAAKRKNGKPAAGDILPGGGR